MRPTAQRLMLHFATAREPINRATEPSAGGHPPSLQKQSWASGVHASGPAQGIWGLGECKIAASAVAQKPVNRATEPSAGGHPPSLQSRAGRQASTHPGQRQVSRVMPQVFAQATFSCGEQHLPGKCIVKESLASRCRKNKQRLDMNRLCEGPTKAS